MGFLNSLGSVFGNKETSVLGIDVGSSSIKIIQLKRKKGKAVLETYGELALGPYGGTDIGRSTSLTSEKLSEALKDILRESNTTTTASGSAIPLGASLIAFITIPKVEDYQLADVISLEARKYIPVPMGEVLLDWSIIPKEDVLESDEEINKGAPQKATTDVLVAAIHNEALSKYQGMMTASGISPSFYEIEIFSTIRACIEPGIHAHMIMDMGASSTKLYIIERGLLRASHVINRGSQDITLAVSKSMSIAIPDAENLKRVYGLKGGPEHKDLAEISTLTLDYVFYEANRVLLNYQKKYNKNISTIVLAGGGVLLKGFDELAKASFQTEVLYANPFSKIETPAFLEQQLTEAGPEFAVAIGVALRKLSELN
ncbi:MAG: type IV pilus assembly protein PilM [Patescibacteria group bacterium]